MKKLIVLIMLLVLIVSCVWGWPSINFTIERNALAREVGKYYFEKRSMAAHFSFELIESVITGSRDRYRERLAMLDAYYRSQHQPFDGPEDGYLRIMTDLAYDEVSMWAVQQLHLSVWPPFESSAQERYDYAIGFTPSDLVLRMHEQLKQIRLLYLSFDDEDFDEMEDVYRARAAFEKNKELFETAVAEAKEWQLHMIHVSRRR